MPVYDAPLRDMRFVLYEVLDGERTAALPGFEDYTRDVVDPILDEAARFCREVLLPLNRSGDEEGCRFENGTVRTPAGFADAYRRYREAGWTALACDPAHGGLGAPATVATLVEEMVCSANLAFGIYPGLSQGAYTALSGFAADPLVARALPKLADGSWTGTMCLTEPQCGTDLGLIRTTARPLDDGGHAVTGIKIFISAGEHDLAENIVHLVLARLPDAPRGTDGISLFLVPKYLPTEQGRPGPSNGVACLGIEHKMGIHASATCTMRFEEARGRLIGAPHQGLRAMFAMMNAARLAVGVQGLGIGEIAYQAAVAHARGRLQGRAPGGARAPDRPADPILVHPDVRRMLLTARAHAEGSRALALWVAAALDRATHHPDPSVRTEADDFVRLITPVAKALMTDLGFESANLAVQVLGGHGYIRGSGVEQLVRDARITRIYEGTNGIQALDLVGRKAAAHGGRYLRRFFHPVAAHIEARAGNPALEPFVRPLSDAFRRLQRASAWIARRGLARPDEAGAAASEYLRLFGLTALAYLWARMAEAALARSGDDPDGFYRAKVATARFFMERILPQTRALLAQIEAGAATITTFDDDAF